MRAVRSAALASVPSGSPLVTIAGIREYDSSPGTPRSVANHTSRTLELYGSYETGAYTATTRCYAQNHTVLTQTSSVVGYMAGQINVSIPEPYYPAYDEWYCVFRLTNSTTGRMMKEYGPIRSCAGMPCKDYQANPSPPAICTAFPFCR